MLRKSDHDLCVASLKKYIGKQRKAPVALKRTPAKEKRRTDTTTDSILDKAALEVCLEKEWERILALWNPEKENLPYASVETVV